MTGRRIRPDTYLLFFVLFASILFLAHAPLLTVPYYWDELGHFIPASLDMYREGALVPRSAVPNAHPPGLMLYLAIFWSIFGVSIPATRAAMLLVASAGVLAAFLLSIQLSRHARGAPAFVAAALLVVSPWFFVQSMLAQLDMPVMALTALALLLFLQGRLHACVAACTALVLVKETGVLVPAVFGAWLLGERRVREASWFLIPCTVLALWFAHLADTTGHVFGSPEFTRFNVFYSMHPVRAALALLRRLYMLFIGGFHWVGTLAILYALRRTAVLATRPWKIAALLAAVHVVAFSMLGGAVLERYLLPVLPILYAAMALSFGVLPGRWRIAAPAVAIAGMLAANFIVPPYRYPLENNLAFADFTALQETAAHFVEEHYPFARVLTPWPLSAALRRPVLGYVDKPLPVREASHIDESVRLGRGEVLVTYSFDREGPSLPFSGLWRRWYEYREPLPPYGLAHRCHLVARWSRRGHWIEIYEAP